MWLVKKCKHAIASIARRPQFWVQIVCATLMLVFQVVRIRENTQGQSLITFLLGFGHMVISLYLTEGAIRFALREGRTPPAIVYEARTIFAVMATCDLIFILVAWFWSHYAWSSNDTTTLIMVGSGGACIAFVVGCQEQTKPRMLRRRWWEALFDPIPQAGLAMLCHSVPQFTMAIKVWAEGPQGVHGMVILIVNVNMIFRLWMLRQGQEPGNWSAHQHWTWRSELLNFVSWLAVTAAWVCRTIG